MEKSTRVVCITDKWYDGPYLTTQGPKKDEICIVLETVISCTFPRGYRLKGYPFINVYNTEYFRPIDEQFGSEVCERIEREMEQVQLEAQRLKPNPLITLTTTP